MRRLIFSGPSVRAILDGRQTQTRRVVKAPKGMSAEFAGVGFACPYGCPGDRLWVRTSRISITLEIIDVRVQRVQQISPADADAEGYPPGTEPMDVGAMERNRLAWFAGHWDSINAKHPWDDNPLVWVITFRGVVGGRLDNTLK